MLLIPEVREIKESDIPFINDYWQNSTPEHLVAMGVDLEKFHLMDGLPEALSKQIQTPYPQKNAYAIIGVLDGKPIGHCNVNKIEFGKSASMHLHLWQSTSRQKGLGGEMVRQAVPYFFKNLKLEVLYCEPYALNPAPNKTLEKLGFEFVKKYTTTPGMINKEQEVNRWKITKAFFEKEWKV